MKYFKFALYVVISVYLLTPHLHAGICHSQDSLAPGDEVHSVYEKGNFKIKVGDSVINEQGETATVNKITKTLLLCHDSNEKPYFTSLWHLDVTLYNGKSQRDQLSKWALATSENPLLINYTFPKYSLKGVFENGNYLFQSHENGQLKITNLTSSYNSFVKSKKVYYFNNSQPHTTLATIYSHLHSDKIKNSYLLDTNKWVSKDFFTTSPNIGRNIKVITEEGFSSTGILTAVREINKSPFFSIDFQTTNGTFEDFNAKFIAIDQFFVNQRVGVFQNGEFHWTTIKEILFWRDPDHPFSTQELRFSTYDIDGLFKVNDLAFDCPDFRPEKVQLGQTIHKHSDSFKVTGWFLNGNLLVIDGKKIAYRVQRKN